MNPIITIAILLVILGIVAVYLILRPPTPELDTSAPRSSDAESDDRGESLQRLAALISEDNQSVATEIELFIERRQDYFDTFQDDLSNRNIESVDKITPEIALIDALEKSSSLAYWDGSHEPDEALAHLDQLSSGALKELPSYSEFEDYYGSARYGIGEYLDGDGDWPSLFDLVEESGLALMAINEKSDSYAIFLVDLSDRQLVAQLAESAGIAIFYADK